MPNRDRFVLRDLTAGRLSLALAGGGLTVLAFAPFGLYPLALIGPIALFLLWQRGGPGWAFVHGWLFGMALLAVGGYWLHLSPKELGGIVSPLAELITVLFIATMSIPYGLAGALFVGLRRRLTPFARAALLFPAVWALTEWMRDWYMSGFPWLVLGYSQTDSPLAGWAPVLGVYGVSLALAASAALLTVWPRLDGRRERTWALAIVVALWAGGGLLRGVDWTAADGELVRVSLIQPLDPDDEEVTEDLWRRYMVMTRQAWRHSELVIWPETTVSTHAVALDPTGDTAPRVAGRTLDPARWVTVALSSSDGVRPYAWRRSTEETLLEPLEAVARAGGKTALFGTELIDPHRGSRYNSLLALGGAARSVYHKRHLVPFGEFLPLALPLRPLWDEFNVRGHRFNAGTAERPLLTVGQHSVGALICYEAAFGAATIQALPEAAWLVIVGSDGMFDGTIALAQHLQISRLRALETGRWVARAKRTGISALIAPDGAIAAQVPVSQTQVLHGTVQPRTGLTPYAHWGNGAVVSLALTLLILSWLLNPREAGSIECSATFRMRSQRQPR